MKQDRRSCEEPSHVPGNGRRGLPQGHEQDSYCKEMACIRSERYESGGIQEWRQCAFPIAFRAPTSDQAIEADVLALDTCICSGQSTGAHAMPCDGPGRSVASRGGASLGGGE